MKIKTKTIAMAGICTALAMVFSYIEFLLPPVSAAVPGIKMGLPNIVIIFALYRLGMKEACAVSAVRLFLSALLFGSVVSLAYSAAGAVLSLCVMSILKRTGKFSVVGVSVAGAVLHNAGQILIAMLIMKTAQIGYYFAILAISGTIAGILIGVSSALILKYVRKI